MILFRPCGLAELRLVWASGMRAWSPRLSWQPIFYPVLNEGYAAQIAREWNTEEQTRVGYVTRFEVEDAFIARYKREVVGAGQHEELWVPAEELEELNAHIIGPIEVIDAYFGDGFVGHVPEEGPWAGLDATGQWEWLASADEAAQEQARAMYAELWILHGLYWMGLGVGA
jgi:hypothetical protein